MSIKLQFSFYLKYYSLGGLLQSNIKKVLPKVVKNFLSSLLKNRPVRNYFKSDFSKRVLISYITTPFVRQSFGHTNFFEALTVAQVFDALGYQVDVVHYECRLQDLKKYDVIYGFGETLEYFFAKKFTPKTKVIVYSTGMHQFKQNINTLNRVKNVFEKKQTWLIDSARLVDKSWFRQIVLSDAIIALGNDEVKRSFEPYYKGVVYQLNAPFYQTKDVREIIDKKLQMAGKSFVWFGSSGLVHKGLDLCLEYFKTRPDLTLHVCGSFNNEIGFVNAYYKELYETDNIITHGFVEINSDKFRRILESVFFIIFPSCSEGGGASVLTVIGNGGLIPLITLETSVTVPNAIIINEFTFEGVEQAVIQTENIEFNQLQQWSLENAEFVVKENSLEVYSKNLKEIISEIAKG